MFRVRVSSEIFTGWMTEGHAFIPATCIEGLPKGCEFFRCEVDVISGDIVAYFLSPFEIKQTRAGMNIPFFNLQEKAEDVYVMYRDTKTVKKVRPK